MPAPNDSCNAGRSRSGSSPTSSASVAARFGSPFAEKAEADEQGCVDKFQDAASFRGTKQFYNAVLKFPLAIMSLRSFSRERRLISGTPVGADGAHTLICQRGSLQMPWTADDAERHTHKATMWRLKELWAKVPKRKLGTNWRRRPRYPGSERCGRAAGRRTFLAGFGSKGSSSRRRLNYTYDGRFRNAAHAG